MNKVEKTLKITITVFLLLLFTTSAFSQRGTKYRNPMGTITHIGDPFVLKQGDLYYMYCTSVQARGFKVFVSTNLMQWIDAGLAYDILSQNNQWADEAFWAPEVVFYNNKYYMTYSARDKKDDKLKLCLAVSHDPLGPFNDLYTPLIQNEQSCIDGHFYFDDDGTPYLYYALDCSDNIINGNHVSQIWAQKMSKEDLKPIGKPTLCISPSQEWEHPDAEWQWNEGPFVLKHDGVYYLMYSANYFASSDYSIGYATSSSPTGPWEKYDQNPVLKSNLDIGASGPGHNSVTVSPDGSEMFIIYHTHTDPANPSGNRTPNLDRMYFENGVLHINGPTRTWQKFPSGAVMSK